LIQDILSKERGRELNTRSIIKGEGEGAEYKIYYQRRGAGCCTQDLLSKERGRELNTRSIIKGEGQGTEYNIYLQWRGAGC
jgi:hypothetical protein